MNWKDYPHLFANGKFKCNYINVFSEKQQAVFDGLHMDCFNSGEEYELIARSISDMTDEEVDSLYEDNNNFSTQQRRAILKNRIENNALYFIDVKYLLERGLYPFDDDKDVIYK